jgi:ABC-type multidrug transport system ATPase subunit
MVAETEVSSAIDVANVRRSYGSTNALDGLTLEVRAGEVHALLGRNGAGKTTLIRLLSGLVQPTEGICRISGIDVRGAPRGIRRLVGLVPSGDRSFYLRLSALENLVFFGRLHGFRKYEARERGLAALEQVGLAEVALQPMNTYSHGMQKRASVARALLVDPPVLLVDEATHDLDPEGGVQIRELIRAAAGRGAAVLWATQRVEEIRGFADRVTVLELGRARFAGTVAQLLAHTGARRFVITIAGNGATTTPSIETLGRSLGEMGRIAPTGAGDGTYLVALSDSATLGNALAALHEADADVLSCRHERPEVEEAFLALVGEGAS